MTRWFEAHTIRQFGRYRVVEPTVVVEVAFDVIMRSTATSPALRCGSRGSPTCGLDKSADEIDTLATVTALHEGLQQGAEHLVTAGARADDLARAAALAADG